MKNYINKLVLLVLAFCMFSINLPVYTISAEEKVKVCTYKETVENGTIENEEFVEFILNKKGLTRDEVNVTYYSDGDVDVSVILDNGNMDIYSPVSEEVFNQYVNSNQEDRLIGEAIMFAIVVVYNLYSVGKDIIDFTCDVVELVGEGSPCNEIKKDMLKGLAEYSEVEFEVTTYLYKDSSCPYPPNSEACLKPPYAYTKTEVIRV